jgi:hypothetical protein
LTMLELGWGITNWKLVIPQLRLERPLQPSELSLMKNWNQGDVDFSFVRNLGFV